MNGGYERLTRQELYDLVWSVPATKLSERFRLSARGLAKLCARHEIPVPERGWWAKKAAGQKVDKLPLPPAKKPHIEKIQIYVRDDFRRWLTAEDQEFFQTRLSEESKASFPVVLDVDDSRHPLIAKSRPIRQLREGTTPLHIAINVTEPLRDRALRLATGLVNVRSARLPIRAAAGHERRYRSRRGVRSSHRVRD
jgi:hypothetical protein